MPKRSDNHDTAKAEYIARKSKGEKINLRELAGRMGIAYRTLLKWKSAERWDEDLPKKKRGGQPGNRNSAGKRNAAGSHKGAPTHNKNAEKDGAYSTIFFDMLTDSEREFLERVPLESRAALEHEMKILKFREHKILYRKRWYLANVKLDMFISILYVNIAS